MANIQETDSFSSLGQTREDVDERIQKAVRRTKSVDINSPSVDRVALFYIDSPIYIIKMASIVEGSSSPSATWNIEFSNDTTNFTPIFNSNQTTDSTTNTLLFFPDVRRINSDFWLWFDAVSISGTVDHFDLTIIYDQ